VVEVVDGTGRIVMEGGWMDGQRDDGKIQPKHNAVGRQIQAGEDPPIEDLETLIGKDSTNRSHRAAKLY